jgi:hypothetical protein
MVKIEKASQTVGEEDPPKTMSAPGFGQWHPPVTIYKLGRDFDSIPPGDDWAYWGTYSIQQSVNQGECTAYFYFEGDYGIKDTPIKYLTAKVRYGCVGSHCDGPQIKIMNWDSTDYWVSDNLGRSTAFIVGTATIDSGAGSYVDDNGRVRIGIYAWDDADTNTGDDFVNNYAEIEFRSADEEIYHAEYSLRNSCGGGAPDTVDITIDADVGDLGDSTSVEVTAYAELVDPDGIVIDTDQNTWTITGWVIEWGSLTLAAPGGIDGIHEIRVSLYDQMGNLESRAHAYVGPCSAVTITYPDDDWIINQSHDDTLLVFVADYDETDTNLVEIRLEHTIYGHADWVADDSILRSALPPDYVLIPWDVSGIPDGDYEIRVLAVCAACENESQVLAGAIDRVAPQLLGDPEPSDHVLSLGDEISFTFSEPINCNTATVACCSLEFEVTGDDIDIDIACESDSSKILMIPLLDYSQIEGRDLVSTVLCVTDAHGNPLANPVSWSFYVECAGLTKALTTGWNWFSLNIHNPDMSPDSVLSSLGGSGDYIKDQTSYAEYVPAWGGWFGALDTLNCSSTYLIKMNSPDTLILNGDPHEVTTPIPLTSGWNWISYLPQAPMDLDDALASLENNGLYIKNQASYAEYVEDWGGWFGTLTEMRPLDGYKIKMNSADTLIYPEPGLLVSSCDKQAPYPSSTWPQPDDWSLRPGQYEFSGAVTCRVLVDGRDTGCETSLLAAFVGGRCRGLQRAMETPEGDNLFYLTVYSNAEGETVTFRYYDPTESILYDIEECLIFHPDMIHGQTTLPFCMNAHQADRLTGRQAAPRITALNKTYPNPFDGEAIIGFSLRDASHVRIEIFNIRGQKVVTLIDGFLEPGAYSPRWDGTDGYGERLSDGIYFCLMKAGQYRGVEKIMLCK